MILSGHNTTFSCIKRTAWLSVRRINILNRTITCSLVTPQWRYGQWARLWIERSGFESWPGTQCVLSLREDTLLSQCHDLSTQVYKWVPAKLMLGVTLRWTSIPSRGEQKYSQSPRATDARISSGLMNHLILLYFSNTQLYLRNFLFMLMCFFQPFFNQFVSNSLLDPTKEILIKFINITDCQGVARSENVTTLITQRSVRSK